MTTFPEGEIDLSIEKGSDVGDLLQTFTKWGIVNTTIDSQNHIQATLTERGKIVLWGGSGLLGALLLINTVFARK